MQLAKYWPYDASVEMMTWYQSSSASMVGSMVSTPSAMAAAMVFAVCRAISVIA